MLKIGYIGYGVIKFTEYGIHAVTADFKSYILNSLWSKDSVQWQRYGSILGKGGIQKHLWSIKSKCSWNFHLWMKFTSFNVWVRYFVWNFKGYLWNSTQNIIPIHWKIQFLWNKEELFQESSLKITFLTLLLHPPRVKKLMQHTNNAYSGPFTTINTLWLLCSKLTIVSYLRHNKNRLQLSKRHTNACIVYSVHA